MVGRKVLEVLQERGHKNHNLFLFASANSAGKKLTYSGKKIKVQELDVNSAQGEFNYAFFCAGSEVSKKYIPSFVNKGTIVIDLSSYYRQSEAPLVVPEVNKEDITLHNKILCNPNCSTIGAMVALNNLHKKFCIERIVFTTFQAVSGAGKKGLNELNVKNKNKLKQFDYVIKNNVIPYIGEVDEDGNSGEELKIINETRKILHGSDISISATCVRVPVDYCHSESINVKFKKQTSVTEILQTLRASKGVAVLNTFNNYPMPIFVKNTDLVAVGRVRADLFQENTFNIWIVSDNIRKGAATNAIQIFEAHIGGI